MPWCVIIGCKNNLKATKRSGKDVSYHIFPKNPQRRTAWINSLKRPLNFNADSSYICSEHFVPDDFECNSLKEELLNIKVKRQLKKTAIPSINIPKYSRKEQLEVSVNHFNNQSLINTSFENIGQDDLQQYCAVPICNNIIDCKYNQLENSKNIIFHKFPSDINLLENWMAFCNCSKEYSTEYQNALICSDHFNEDNYENKYIAESKQPIKVLKKDAIPTLNGGMKIINIKRTDEESVRRERKKLVDKLLADYEEQQNIEDHLKVEKYPRFFSPKINPNAKLGDKLKLLKSIDNPETYSPPKKRKTSFISKSSDMPNIKNLSQNNDQVIQVSAVKGGLMLHALPQAVNSYNSLNLYSEKIKEEEEEEIIIVTGDDLEKSSHEIEHKNNNNEVIIVTNLKETENTCKNTENLPKINSDDNNCSQYILKDYKKPPIPLYTAKVSLNVDNGCQVSFPCNGCEHRSLKINKLLRERTMLLKDLNQNTTWKDPDEISTLRKMNGVLSLLLMQCVGEKYSKKSSPIRIDLIKDSVERINQGWSMQDTSKTLCKVLSCNAYEELANTFKIINGTL